MGLCVIVLCFVVRYFMSILVLQSSWWGRELVALLNLSSWCLVMVERLFLAVPRGCLQFVIVVFPDYTHLLFFYCIRRHVRTVKIQISLNIHTVWAESLFSVSVNVGPACHRAHIEYYDQTAWMRRLICVIHGPTCQLIPFAGHLIKYIFRSFAKSRH